VAINFLRLDSLGRSQGKVLAAALAYLEREELEDRRTGLVYNYQKRGGLVAKGAFFPQVERGECRAKERNLSRQEKEEFCLAVELKEKQKNSRLAKEVLTAIPAELPQEKQLELAQIFAKKLVERYRVGAFWAIHEPPEGGDRRNFHLHLLLTTRELGSGNLGQKVKALDAKSEMQLIKKTWMELANEFLPEGKRLEEPQKDPLAEPKLPHLGREATWFERKTGKKSRKRLEFEAQLKEWQTLTSELRELERQRQELERQWQEQERQRQQQEQKRQAEQEKLRQEQELAKEKYRLFAATKKLVNRYKNPQIGTDREGEILLPDQTLKFSELSNYSLESLQEVYQTTRRKIERDLDRRIGQLPPISRQIIGLRPLKELTDDGLIGLFPTVAQLEQSEKEEQQKREAERKRLEQELERQRQEQERQAERQRAEREKLRREQEENKKYRFFYVTKKMVGLMGNPQIGTDREGEILLPDRTLKLSELKGYSLEFLEQSFLAVRRQVEKDLSRRISQFPPEIRGLITHPVTEIEKIENLSFIDLIREVKALEELTPKKTVRPLKKLSENLQQELERRQAQEKLEPAKESDPLPRLRERKRRRGQQDEETLNQSGTVDHPVREYRSRSPDLEWD